MLYDDISKFFHIKEQKKKTKSLRLLSTNHYDVHTLVLQNLAMLQCR